MCEQIISQSLEDRRYCSLANEHHALLSSWRDCASPLLPEADPGWLWCWSQTGAAQSHGGAYSFPRGASQLAEANSHPNPPQEPTATNVTRATCHSWVLLHKRALGVLWSVWLCWPLAAAAKRGTDLQVGVKQEWLCWSWWSSPSQHAPHR